MDQLDQSKEEYLSSIESGTLLYFEGISDGIVNTVEYLKKAIAMYFRFSLYDNSFKIHLNDEEITENCLAEFADNTQFLWRINDFNEPFFAMMHGLAADRNLSISNHAIRGYIASAQKPSQLKIRGTQEKISIDLFVNGRLREKDILRHIPSARIVENYVYGQIHFDELDKEGSIDIFTSNRESVISDNPIFVSFLKELNHLFGRIIDEWDDFRRKIGDDGDPDNPKLTKKARKAQELFNASLEDYPIKQQKKKTATTNIVEGWARELSEEATFNIPSYTDCFISENLLRKYILENQVPLSKEAITEASKMKAREIDNKNRANINYDIRASKTDVFYLDMDNLANMVDKPSDKIKDPGIGRSAVIYKPIRDAVGHTSIITKNAKQQLSLEYENIKARLSTILQEYEEKEGKGK